MQLQTNDLLILLYDLFLQTKININDVPEKIKNCIQEFVNELCKLYHITYSEEYFNNLNIVDCIYKEQSKLFLSSCYLVESDTPEIKTKYSKFDIVNFIYDLFLQSNLKIIDVDKNIYRICISVLTYKNETQLPKDSYLLQVGNRFEV